MSPPNIEFIKNSNAYRFKPTISEDTLPAFNLPSNWLNHAHKLFPNLSEHTSDDTATARLYGVYSGRADLVRSFSFFYAIFTDQVTLPGMTITEGMKQSMQAKILEGIDNCSPGFHNRINSLYASFFVPKTVSELLQRVRQSILQEIVCQESDDVHRQNYVSLRAQELGYGTECINIKDIYASNDGAIRQNPEILLRNGFIKAYTWHNITRKLQEELKSVLIGTFAYRGCLAGQEEGYDTGEYTSFIKYLNELFSVKHSEQEWLIFDEDYKVIDINWQLIHQLLWNNIKQTIFNLPIKYVDIMSSLFGLEKDDENIELKAQPLLHKLGSLLQVKELQNLFMVLPQLPNKVKIDALFSALLAKDVSTDVVIDELNAFINNHTLSPIEKSYLATSFKSKSESNYQQLKDSYFLWDGRHLLIDLYKIQSNNFSQSIEKLRLLEPKERLEILCEPSRNVVDEIIRYRSYNTKKVATFRAKLLNIIESLNECDSDQLDEFFNIHNIIFNAYQYHRESLLPLLNLLKKCQANTIVQQLLPKNHGGNTNFLFLLFNAKNVLGYKSRNEEDQALSEEKIHSIQMLMLEIFGKIPPEFQINFMPSPRDEKNLLLEYQALNIPNSIGQDLLKLMSKEVLELHFNHLPETLDYELIKMLAPFMVVAPNDLVLKILRKKATYEKNIFDNVLSMAKSFILKGKSKEVAKSTFLSRIMFTSKEHYPTFKVIFDRLSETQRQQVVQDVFIKKENTELSKWFECMAFDSDYSMCRSVLAYLDKDSQCQQIVNALGSSNQNWGKILPHLSNLKKEQYLTLFEVKGKNKFGFITGTLKEALHEGAVFHGSLATFLKSITETDKNFLLTRLFGKQENFLSKHILKNSSYDLLSLFPEELLFLMIQHGLTHNLMTSEKCEKCFGLLPLLKKGPKVRELEVKYKLERNFDKKAELKEVFEQLNSKEQRAINESTKNLYQILLQKLPSQGKTFFQIMLEQAPEKMYQYKHWQNCFVQGKISETFFCDALTEPLTFNDEVLSNATDIFGDALEMVQQAPSKYFLKNMSAISKTINNVKEVALCLEKIGEIKNSSAVKNFFTARRSSNNKTLLEEMADKKNAASLLKSAIKGVLQIAQDKQITFQNILVLSNSEKFLAFDEEDKREIFAIIWEENLWDRKDIIEYLKQLNAQKKLHKQFYLLSTIIQDLSDVELTQIFYSSDIKDDSLFSQLVKCRCCFNDPGIKDVMMALPETLFYSLINEEEYTSAHDKLGSYLFHHGMRDNFFSLYDWVAIRQDSTWKRNFFSENKFVPLLSVKSHIYDTQGGTPGCIEYILSLNVSTAGRLCDDLGVVTDEQAIYLKRFFTNLIKTNRGLKYFNKILFHREQGQGLTPFYKLLQTRKNDLYDVAFSTFNTLSVDLKYHLLLVAGSRHSNIYSEVCKDSGRQSSEYQKNMIKQHIVSLPHKYWEQLTDNTNQFFFDNFHLNKSHLISPYLFMLSREKLNQTFRGGSFCKEHTLRKVFNELNNAGQPTHREFLTLLKDKGDKSTITNVLFSHIDNKDAYAVDVLVNHSSERSLLMDCLHVLNTQEKQEIIHRWMRQISSHNFVKQELQQLLNLKIEILRLEEIRNKFLEENSIDISEKKIQLINVLDGLLISLNQAFTHTINNDGNLERRQEAFNEVKQLLNQVETRQVINSHRGVKKILTNVLLAIAGLGVGYLVGCLINYYMTEGKHFFFHPATNTEKNIIEIEDNIQKFARSC